jgi:hypothetical protein
MTDDYERKTARKESRRRVLTSEVIAIEKRDGGHFDDTDYPRAVGVMAGQ